MFRAERAEAIASDDKFKAGMAKQRAIEKARLRRMMPLDECAKLATDVHAAVMRRVIESGATSPWAPAVNDLQDWGCFTRFDGGELTVKGECLLAILEGR